MNDRCKRNIRKLNVLHIRIKQLHHPRIRRSLLRILCTNSQLVRVARRQEQGQTVIVGQRLDQLEQINHINTQNVLGGAIEILETVGVKTQIRQNGMGLIHINHLDPRRIKLQIRLGKNLL